MEKRMAARDGWKYCYRALRSANCHYKVAREYATRGDIETAAYYFMLAGKVIQDADMGHQFTGSVYANVMPYGYHFSVYTYDNGLVLSKRHSFVFKFGDSSPENNDANHNRRQWQIQAQAVERIAELRKAKLDIARSLNAMSDEEFFTAYKAIKAAIKSIR